MDRRQFMAGIGVGAANLLSAPHRSFAGPEVATDRLLDLAQRIRETSHKKVFDLAVDTIGHGATPRTLLGATFIAGVNDVKPRPVGNNLHSVMAVEASYRLAETATTQRDAWLVALWNLDAFKATQHERDESWVLPPPPKVKLSSEAAARRELVAALDSWDEERADRAVVGLVPFHDRKSLWEILWPYTARCMANLGHKPVYGAMTEAVLRRIDWRHAESTARSVVFGLFSPDGRSGGHLDRAWQHSLGLVNVFPEGWLRNKGGKPSDTLALLRQLRAGDHVQAKTAALDALRDGIAPHILWDAIRLGAAELWLRRKSSDPDSGAAIRAVHALTEVWSMGHAWRATGDERNRKLLLLQAASWIPEFRDMLVVRDAIDLEGPGIDALATVADLPRDVDELLEHGSPATVRAFLEKHPRQAASFRERLRRRIPAKGLEYHQFKAAVAVEDETAASDPRWAPYLLAPAVGYMPTRTSADHELTERSLFALAQASVV